MGRELHPSLIRVYDCSGEAKIAFVDETYTALRDEGKSFYALTATLYRRDELSTLREDLIEIVDDFFGTSRPYWHTTEALRTSSGRKKYTELLEYLSENEDISFVTCQTAIDPNVPVQTNSKKRTSPEEFARRECLKQAFKRFLNHDPDLQGVVFEKRQSNEENDRDRAFLKALRRRGEIPNLQRAWVSPYDEIALWVPDIVGMAYRHKRVFPSTSLGACFDRYLAGSTLVYEFDPQI